jgi:hypothetical protein
MAASVLADWANFYVIMGSSAAALTGLTFVVIALASSRNRASPSAMRVFVTPTIVHFGSVLALAAFLSVPHQSLVSLSLGFGIGGAGGLIYGLVLGANLRGALDDYVPVREDWLWHVIFPTVVYAALLVMSLLIWRSPEQGLYGAAVISMLLLYIGIHNAWDVAVSISLRKDHREPP